MSKKRRCLLRRKSKASKAPPLGKRLVQAAREGVAIARGDDPATGKPPAPVGPVEGLSSCRAQELVEWRDEQAYRHYSPAALAAGALDAELRAIRRARPAKPGNVDWTARSVEAKGRERRRPRKRNDSLEELL